MAQFAHARRNFSTYWILPFDIRGYPHTQAPPTPFTWHIEFTMATHGEDLDLAVSYTLQRFGCEVMTLEAERWASVKYMYEGKDVFVWVPTGFGKSVCYKVLPFVFDVKLGSGNDSNSNRRHKKFEWVAISQSLRSVVNNTPCGVC